MQCSQAFLFAVALLAGAPHPAVGAGLDDAAALVQSSIKKTRTMQAPPEEDCGCQQWNEVYSSGAVNCGDGLELNGSMSPPMDEGICSAFMGPALYPNQDHDLCIKSMKITKSSNETTPYWCYVPASCANLNGGRNVNEHLSYKFCDEDDRTLGDLTPAQLQGLSQRTHTDPQMLAVMAYQWEGPSMRTPMNWYMFVHPGCCEINITEGSNAWPAHGARVGKAPLPDTFRIITTDRQIWDVPDGVGFSCWQNCNV
jgi:hypothetical protein